MSTRSAKNSWANKHQENLLLPHTKMATAHVRLPFLYVKTPLILSPAPYPVLFLDFLLPSTVCFTPPPRENQDPKAVPFHHPPPRKSQTSSGFVPFSPPHHFFLNLSTLSTHLSPPSVPISVDFPVHNSVYIILHSSLRIFSIFQTIPPFSGCK